MYKDQQKTVTLYVLDGESPSIFGCDWLSVIKLNWRFIKWTTTSKGDPNIEAVLRKFSEVFKDELGTIKNYSAKLQVRDYTTPYFCRPCPVRFSLKPKLDAELDWLVEKGILKEVSHSAWALPVVTVSKKDGRVRLCGDYKVSVNRSLHVDQHPLPTPEELFSALTGGQQFSTLDLSAYQQSLLEPSSRELTTISTHRGLYQYTRLPFGIALAPAIFQWTMDTILDGIPNVLCYIDDILITGKTKSEHLQNLQEVLNCLHAHGVRARAYILKKRACNSHSTSLDCKILSVTKNSTSGQLRIRESVCRLRDVWFIRAHPPPSTLRHTCFPHLGLD